MTALACPALAAEATRLVSLATIGFTALVAYTLVEALAGRPFLRLPRLRIKCGPPLPEGGPLPTSAPSATMRKTMFDPKQLLDQFLGGQGGNAAWNDQRGNAQWDNHVRAAASWIASGAMPATIRC